MPLERIPPSIHYCWFGGSPLPDSVKKCIKSWEKYCPEFTIKRWDESNYDINKIPYIKQAYQAKKYAFVSDYARLDIIYQHGGIYLDTDVQCIQSLAPLLTNKCYFGMELPGKIASGLGFGAIAKHPFLKEAMKFYESQTFTLSNGRHPKTTTVTVLTSLFKRKGLVETDTKQTLADITIYPTEYFCPYSMLTRKTEITQNTYSIHHYDASWYSGNALIKKIKFWLIPIKIKIRKCFKIYG